jgi:ribosomal-protein-alanine N-acetyltransferase
VPNSSPNFTENFSRVLAEQEAGTSAFYVLVDEAGAVLGRFNLYGVDGRGARVGYRVGSRPPTAGLASRPQPSTRSARWRHVLV